MLTYSRPDPRTAIRFALAAVLALHVLLHIAPWHVLMPGLGSESSWQQAIGHAAASGWQWGRDIAFTYGPLGYLRAPIYDDALLAPMIVWGFVLAVSLIVGLIALLGRLPTIAAVMLYAVIGFAASMLFGRGVLSALPLLAALLYFRDPQAPPLGAIVALLAGAAVFADVYVPSLVFGTAAFALMDASRIMRRRVPVFVPLYIVLVIAIALVAGQELASLPAYLRSSIESIGGYADAMSLVGNQGEIVAFLVVSGIALAAVAWLEWTRWTETKRITDALLAGALVALFWFVEWKGGFVRHDKHSIGAWGLVAIAIAAYAAIRWAQARSLIERASLVGLAVAAACGATFTLRGASGLSSIGDQAIQAFWSAPISVLPEAKTALVDPSGFVASLRAQKQAAYARIRAQTPPLQSSATADLIGTEQGTLFAHGLDYRPQPVFQAYAAYTPWLLALNREQLRSDRAADTIYLGNSTIDNRYPLHDAGTSIVDLATRYKAEDVVGNFVRLHRRSAALESTTLDLVAVDARLGQWIAVPAVQAIAVLRAEVTPRLRARALRFAWKLPPVTIVVRLVDGTEATHRIVPAVAADGLLLSPYASSVVELAGIASGRLSEIGGKRVVAVKVDADPALYREAVSMHLTRVDVAFPVGEQGPDGVRRLFDRREVVGRFAQSVAGKGQIVEARGSLLWAHAPATPAVALAGVGGVRLRYGIFDDAWRGERRTDGVCFRVSAIAASGTTTRLHERCLQPLDNPADRGEQQATIAFESEKPVRLVLETDCRESCEYDWSYWKDIDILPGPNGIALEPQPRPYFDRYEAAARLAQSVIGKGQNVEARGTLLFAHAPASPAVSLPSGGNIEVSYGIFDSAWSEDRRTDGVCFRIRAIDAQRVATTLHERCLTPVEREADRTEQRVSVRVAAASAVTIVFETDCRVSCSYDWSYWKDIDVTP